MERTLSVYFNVDRTYLAVLAYHSDGATLELVDSTENAIDPGYPEKESTKKGIEELNGIISNLPRDIDRLSVTLPAESVLVTQFPGKSSMEPDKIRKLANLEVRQNFPTFNFEDFYINVIPLNNENGNMMLGVIIANEYIRTCKNILSGLEMPINKIEISQLNAHSAFLYNYPEKHDATVALLGIEEQFIDISVIRENQPAYYNLLSLSDPGGISELLENEFNKIIPDVVDSIQGAYFFGTALDKDILLASWETCMMLGMEAVRLNAFRMMSTDLDKRTREYCSRTLHIFPPCIGGALPTYHKKVKIY